MNILFVNYGDYTTNSLNHIGGFANSLSAAGHACVVAVPTRKDTLSAIADPLFIPALYSEVLAQPSLFPNRRPADLIHAWTSREGVRRFVVAYQRAAASPAPLIVHLEDNEEHLIAAYARRPIAELRALPASELDGFVVDALPHPVRHRTMLRLADAATVIVEKLRDFVPEGVPATLLPPGVDGEQYRPQAPDPTLRASLGLDPAERVLVFTGSNTFANEPEMRELYLAVRLLNQRGVPTRLVRTGFNSPDFLAGLPSEVRSHVLDLGFVPKARLPQLLALADVLVQPGRPGPFNDYRLPSKLPEFLASGRPVLLPHTNIALGMSDGIEAEFLSSGTPEDIAERCQKLFADPDRARRMGAAGAAFARKHFDLTANTAALMRLYERTIEAGARPEWEAIRSSEATDLTAAATLLAHALRKGGQQPPDAKGFNDLAAFASDLAVLDRLEEERAAAERTSGSTSRAGLEQAAAELALTKQHAGNLEKLLVAKQRHLKLSRQLSTQHIRNLEGEIERQRSDIADRERRHVDANVRLASLDGENAALRSDLKASQSRHNEARGRIDEIERMTRAQVEALNKEHAKLAARIAEMDGELNARDQKIRRMLRSLSWRMTAPLRDLERLIGRLTGSQPADKAANSAVASAERPIGPADSASVSNGGARAEPLPGNAAAATASAPPPNASSLPPSAAIPEACAGGSSAQKKAYTFNFDHPRSWNTASNKLLILGWCYENAGAPIRGLRARLGEQVTEGTYGSKRLDVLAAHGKSQAEYSGVKIDVRTFLGDHPLVVEVLHDDGWHAYFQTSVHVGKPGDPTELSEYEKWFRHHEALAEPDLAAIRSHIAALARRPLISVVMPVYNPPPELLEKAIQSVRNQLYPNWELCIADDASTNANVRPIIERHAAEEPRIRTLFRETNGHICAATNSALDLAGGAYIALFDHDDILHPTALYEVAVELEAHPNAQYIYSDEDKIDGEDRRFDPYFKPDWNPDLIHGQNYTSHLSVFDAALVRSLGGFRAGYEGSQDWDLILRAIERIEPKSIRHIPKILYHWRAVPGSTALQLAEKNYPVEAARRALTDHFSRRGEQVELVTVPGDHWRVKYPVPQPPPAVSLIIPTRNAAQLVKQAVASILSKTDYPNYEILIVDNGSDDPEALAYLEAACSEDARVKVIPYNAPFNYSAINNHAVDRSSGEIIGLLNNDVEAINRDWLSEMVSQAARPGIGAVGAMLYYPLNTVQHAGVILGLGGVAGHPFKEFPRGDQGQKNRMRLVQNYSAVTAACLLIRKDRFLEVGGLNEKELAIAFNDVDLCCKLVKAGYRNLWTPYAEFYHHESATRGVDDTPEKKARFQSEIEYMMGTWSELLMNDPAYNPNLTLVGEDFSPAYLPRTRKPWLSHLP